MRALGACDLCGGSAFETLFTGRDQYYRVSDEVFHVQRCRDCSLIFLNPQPSVAELERYYPRDAYYSLSPALTRTDRATELVARARGIRRHAVAPLRPFVRSVVTVPGGRLLDVGCGAGQYLRLARSLGMEAHGVEPGLTAAEAAALDPGIVASTLEAAGFPDDHFDVVTMNHVLEHVPSPTGTLAELRRVLRPGGTLVVATPQSDSLAYKVFGRHWVQLDIPRHLYTFSTRTLLRYADKAGLRVARVRHNSRPLQFLGSLLYWSNQFAAAPRYLSESRMHRNPVLLLATLPLAYAANALHLGDQVEVFMTK